METLWKPFDQANIDSPYSMYKTLREEAPVYKANTGEWIITRHQDIKQILLDSRFQTGNRIDWIQRVVKKSGEKDFDISWITKAIDLFLIFRNNPEHSFWRNLLTQLWPPEKDLKDLIHAKTISLLKNAQQQFDFVKSFSRPLSARVIGEIIGLDQDEIDHITFDGVQMVRVTDLILSLNDLKEINESSKRVYKFFEGKFNSGNVEGMMKELKKDSNLEVEDPGYEKRISICIFIFMAGLETTSSAISLSIKTLADTKSFDNQLIAGNFKKIIPELIRYDSPTQLIGRFASEDIKIYSQLISKNDVITLCIGSGNRDPQVFDNPDELDFSRTPNPLLSFGAGSHFCLGEKIARLELEIAINHLTKEFKSLTLVEKPLLEPYLTIRRLESMVVELN